jgi:hypothetical protein
LILNLSCYLVSLVILRFWLYALLCELIDLRRQYEGDQIAVAKL